MAKKKSKYFETKPTHFVPQTTQKKKEDKAKTQTKAEDKKLFNEIMQSNNFNRDSSGNLVSVTPKSNYKDPSWADKIKENYKLTYDKNGTLTNLEFTSKGREDLLDYKVKKGTATEEESIDRDVYKVWNKHKLGDASEKLLPYENDFFESVKTIGGWNAAKDFDEILAKGDKLREALAEYIKYSDRYEPEKKQKYVDLYNKYGETIDQVKAQKEYYGQFKDADEHEQYQLISSLKSYKELNQLKGDLRRRKGTGSAEQDANIDKQLKWLEQYGMTDTVKSTMTDDDWKYEKNIRELDKRVLEDRSVELNSKAYQDKFFKDKLASGMSYNEVKNLLNDEIESVNARYDNLSREIVAIDSNKLTSKARQIERAVMSNKDFEKYSVPKQKNFANPESDAFAVYNSDRTIPSPTRDAYADSFKMMTDEQKKVFYYLYQKNGEKASSEYLESLRPELNLKYTNQEKKDAYEFGKAHPYISILGNAIDSVTEGITSTGNNITNIIKAQTGAEIDPNDAKYAPAYAHQERIRGGSENFDSTLGNIAYNGINAIAEMTAIMLASKGIGGVAGKGTQIADKVTTIANSVLNSSRTMQDTILEYKAEGESDANAVSMGIVYGAIESLLEAIGMEKLLKTPDILSNDSAFKKFRNYLMKFGTDFTAEGGEEVFTSIAQSIAAFITNNREHDTFWGTYDEYRNNGNSEAISLMRAIQKAAPEYLNDLVVGGFAGGVFGGINTYQNVRQTNAVADKAEQYFGTRGADKDNLISFLYTLGVEDEGELARLSDAIDNMSTGKKLDNGLEAEIKDDAVLRGVFNAYLLAKENYIQKDETGTSDVKAVSESIKEAEPKATNPDTQNKALTQLKYTPSEGDKTETVKTVATSEKAIEITENKADNAPAVVDTKTEATNTAKALEGKSFLADKHQKSLNAIKRSDAQFAIESAGRAGKQLYSSEVTVGGKGMVDSLISEGYSSAEAQKIANRMYSFMYDQGYKGRNMDVAVQAVNDIIIPGYEATAKMFYAAGKIDAGNVMSGKVNAKLIRNNTLKAMQKGGKITYKTFRALNGLASRLGVDIEIVDKIDGGHKASFDTKTGKLLISADVKHKITVSAIHEAVHAIRSVDSKEYNKISNLVYELVSKDTKAYGSAWTQIANQYKKEATGKDGRLNRDLIDEEFTARFLSEVLDSKVLINELAKTDRNKLQKIYDAFRYLMDYIGRKYKGEVKGDTEFSDTFALLDSEKERIMKAFNNALGVTESVQSSRVKLSGDGKVYHNEYSEFETEDGVFFNKASWDDGGKTNLSNYLNTLIQNGEIDKDYADDVMGTMDMMAKLSDEMSDVYKSFGKWAVYKVEKNINGAPMSCIVSNGEYALNIDFSTKCVKRETLDAVINKLATDSMLTLIKSDKSATAVAVINGIIKKHGLDVACPMCFVDAKRQNILKWSKSFCDMWNTVVNAVLPKGETVSHFGFAGEVKNDSVTTLTEANFDNILKRLPKKLFTAKGNVKPIVERMISLMQSNKDNIRYMAIEDLASSVGLDAIKSTNEGLYNIVNSHQGSAKPKLTHGNVPYNNDIINAKNFTVESAYKVGGVRVQSFSDYIGSLFFDYMQMFAELSAKKLPAHAYTKVLDFVKIFGKTGIKINMSGIPAVDMLDAKTKEHIESLYVNGKKTAKFYSDSIVRKLKKTAGLDADGNFLWGDESIDIEEAKKIASDAEYGKNCGIIAVGVSNAHIEKLLATPWIHMVIPYHASGINPIVARMYDIDLFNDYTKQQTTKVWHNGKYVSINNKDVKVKDFDFYGTLESLKGKKDAYKKVADAYLEWCNEGDGKHPYMPKFNTFRDNPNYYKLLADFRMTDTEGNYSPQGAVTMNFPDSETLRGYINDSLKNDQNRTDKINKEYDAIVEEVKAAFNLDSGTLKAKKDVAKTSVSGYNENTEQYRVMWTIEENVMSRNEVSAFYEKVSEMKNQKWHNYKMSKDGEYIFEIENKLVYFDGDYDYPEITKVIEFNTNNENLLHYGRGLVYDCEEFGYSVEDAIQIAEITLGEGNIYQSNFEDSRAFKREISRRAGKNGTKPNSTSGKNVKHLSSDEVSDFDETLVPLPRQSDEEILADVFSLKEEVQKQLDDMIDKYGVMDKGATPARNVDLPRKVDDNTKVRRAARTEIESEIVTNKMAETMTEMIVKGDRRVTYRPTSNKKQIEAAKHTLNTVGYDEMVRQWFAKYYSDSRITPQFIADAEILIVESQRRDDSKTYTDLLLALPEIGTEGGQVIQAYSMIKKLTGTDALSTLDAVIGKLQLIKNKVEKGKSTRITVPQELKERYIQAKNRENQQARAEVENISDEIAETLSEQTGASESDIKDMLVFAWDYAMQIINSNGNVSIEDVIMSQDLKQQAMDGMKATRTELEDELSDITEVLDGLLSQEEETKKLMSDIRKAENMVSNARERLEKLDSKMAEAENELISLEAEQDELLQKLNDAKTNKRVLDSIKNRIESLKGRLEKARAKAIEYGNEIPKAQEEYRRAYGEYVDALAEIEKAKAFKTMSDKMKAQAQSAMKRADKWADKLVQAQQDYENASVDLRDAMDKYTAAKEKRDALKEKTNSSEKSANVQMVAISKAIERIQDEMNAIYGFNKDGTPKVVVDIDEETITKYGQAVLDEALGKDVQTESDKILEEIKNHVAEQVPSTLSEKVRAWRYFAMLANPRTHMRNISSNMLMVPVNFIKNIISIGAENTVGRLVSKYKSQSGSVTKSKSLKGVFTHGDEYAFAKRDALKVQNLIQGMGETYGKVTPGTNYKDIMSRRKTYRHGTWMSYLYNNPLAKAMASAMEESNFKFFSGTGKVIKKVQNEGLLNVLTEGNSNLLEWEDWLFSKKHYARALTSYIVANKYDIDSMTDEQLEKARSYAIMTAQKATFRDYSAFASLINSLNKSKPFGFIVDTILPFRKTPTNILKRGIEYSPIGLVKELTKGLCDVKSGYKTVYEWCDDLAASLTGSAILAIGALGFYKGFLTGPDDDENETFEQKLLGLQNYALKIGKYTYSIDWMSPAAMPLFTGYNIAKMFSDDIGEGDMWELISNFTSALPTMAGPLFDMSMLEGVANVFTIAGTEKKASSAIVKVISSLLGSYVGQFVPTILKAYTRTVDNVYRQTYIDKNSKFSGDIQYILTGFYRAIPQLNRNLIPKVDRHGLEMTNAVEFENKLASKAWRVIQNFISPGYLNRIDANAVDKELIRIGNKLGEAAYDILPKSLNKYISIDGERYNLNPQEYSQAQKTFGTTYYGKLDEIIASDYYKSLSDKDKAQLIAEVKTFAENKAKRTVIPTYVPSKEKAYAFLNNDDGYKFVLNEEAESDKERNIVGIVSNIIGKVLPFANYDLSEKAVSNAFRDKLYSYAREVAKETDDPDYHTDQDWVNIVKDFSDEQRADYFYAIALKSSAPTTSEGKEAIYNADIDDAVKLLATNESAYEKYISELADTGIDAVAYAQYKSFYDSAKSDEGGKTKKEKVVEWLNSQPLSDEQKSALYRLNYKDTSAKGKSLLDGVKWDYIYANRASDNYSAKVGQKIADTSKYNNSAAPGQCVWFARGRAKEKLGKTIPAIGNANQMYYNAKDSAKLDATKDNIKADILVSYKVGTSAAGQTAGHVIYVEAVDGDTVYYTEGGYGSNSGILKTTTKDKLLQGKSGSGSTIGTGIIGFIDVKKY